MLSNKEIVCPNNLLDFAHKKKGVKVAVVNAGKPLPMLSVQDAVNENLIEPIFIGNKEEINKCAQDLKWDISNFEIIHEPVENNTAAIAAKLASDGMVKIIVKGHIHTDVLMKEILKREYDLLGKTRLSHIWHMTVGKNDKPLIITDGALNVLPNVKTKMHILKNVINFSKRIEIERPKIAILSATERKRKGRSGKDNAFYGKRHSTETKQLLSDKAIERGDCRSKDQISAWVENIAKKPKSEEHKAKIGRKGYIMLKNVDTLESIRIKKEDKINYDLTKWMNPLRANKYNENK